MDLEQHTYVTVQETGQVIPAGMAEAAHSARGEYIIQLLIIVPQEGAKDMEAAVQAAGMIVLNA